MTPDGFSRSTPPLERWELTLVAAFIADASAVVGLPILFVFGFYMGSSGFARGPSPLALPIALDTWWGVVAAGLGVIRGITRLRYRPAVFALLLVGAQAGSYVAQAFMFRENPWALDGMMALASLGGGVVVSLACVARAARQQRSKDAGETGAR